jgi:tetratricopeptide (TPR) repeat protein
MKKIKLFFIFIFLSAVYLQAKEYQLLVKIKSENDIEKLQKFGFNCREVSKDVLNCAKSKDIYYLKQLQDFLEKNNINAKIAETDTKEKSVKVIKKRKTVHYSLKKSVSNTDLRKNVRKMYDYLNSGNYSKALEIAERLKNTKYKNDAYFVIGLIDIKKENFRDACYIFKKIYTVKKGALKLRNDSCSVFYMQLGYKHLNLDDFHKAFKYFNKSLSYKNNKEAKLGIFYMYLKEKKYKKAKNIIDSLYKKYSDDKKVIQAYADYLIETKQFDKLEKFQSKLSPEQQQFVKKAQIYSELGKIKEYIDNKEYDLAEEKLKKMYVIDPNNIYVLLNLGYIYLLKNEPYKAENFYRNAYMLDNSNIDALKGLKAVYVKTKNYKKALNVVKKLKEMGFEDKDENKIKELYLISEANKALKAKQIDLAKKYALNALKLNSDDADAYLILANIYKNENNKDKYCEYISKAYELNPDNIGIKIAYMYSLLDLDFFEQAKTVLLTIDSNKLTSEEKEKLKEFYKVFYEKFSNYYLNEKNYKRAKKVALEGLKIFPDDKTLLEVLGWSCYNLKDYKCAKTSFNYARALAPDDEKAKLGLAYTYLNLKETDKLEPLLNELEQSKNPKILEGVSNIYYSLGRYKDAQRVIDRYESLSSVESNKKLPLFKEQKKITKPQFPKTDNQRELPYILDLLNENPNKRIYVSNKKEVSDTVQPVETEKLSRLDLIYKKKRELPGNQYKGSDSIEGLKKKIKLAIQNYTSYLSAGVKIRSKSGTSGKNKLSDVSPFIKLNYFFNENLSFNIGAYFTNLSSGELTDYAHFGSVYPDANITRKVPSSYSGIEPFGGFNFKSGYFDVIGNLGLTPKVDNKVGSTLTYLLESKLKYNNKKFGLGIYKKSLKDSILSYVGTKDPYSDNDWGRATENGIKLSYEQPIGKKDSLFYSELTLGKIKGKDIQNNKDLNFIAMPKYYIGNILSDEDYLGLFFLYNKFYKNQDCYYYGCGGYFSPKNLVIAAPMLEGFKFVNKNLGFHYKAFLGPMFIDNDNKNSLDASFDGYLGGAYKLTDNVFLNLSGELRKTSKYSEFFSSLYLQYFFDKRYNVNKKDLKNLEKEIYKP